MSPKRSRILCSSYPSVACCVFFFFFFQHMLRYTRGFLTSIPLRASTSYGTRNFTANSTIRQVVPFSRTAKMALSGLLDRPDRFSPSCSASTTDSASTPDQGRGNKGVTDGVGGQGGTHTHDLTHTRSHVCRNMQNQQKWMLNDLLLSLAEGPSHVLNRRHVTSVSSRQSQNQAETVEPEIFCIRGATARDWLRSKQRQKVTNCNSDRVRTTFHIRAWRRHR